MRTATKPMDDASRWSASAAKYETFAELLTAPYALAALNIVSRIEPSMQALDVAAGTGAISPHIAEMGAHVRATDFSPHTVARLTERLAGRNPGSDTRTMDKKPHSELLARTPPEHRPTKSRAAPLVVAALLGTSNGAAGLAQQAGPPLGNDDGAKAEAQSRLAIQPMTAIGRGGSGYLADPQPVRLAPSSGDRVQILSGTTKAIIRCAYPIRPRCFSWTPVTVDAGSLAPKITAASAAITNFQNLDLFQDDAGGWHAVVTIGVNTQAHPRHWTVMAHAHPTAPATPGSAPLTWSADTVLAGSLAEPVQGNYDGKYVEEHGRLFLLYVKTFAPGPALRNGIVIQPMLSPTQPEPVAPTTPLSPGDRDGPLESERYDDTEAKLVEAPFISRIGGKYALVYSSGAYLTPGYKAGVAWSDTFLPPPGGSYRKVLEPDREGLWGEPGRREVRYLIQSQEPRWPNFTGGQVIGPGVAAAVQGPGGAWWLYFNGFAPGDRPIGRQGRIDGSHRHPFFVRLRAAVPPDRSVAQATDGDLAGWLKPKDPSGDKRIALPGAAAGRSSDMRSGYFRKNPKSPSRKKLSRMSRL